MINAFLLGITDASGFLSDLDGDQRFVLIIIGISCLTLLAIVLGGTIAGIWSSVRVKQIEAELKQDMLDRGMSAEEIQQVIEAAPRSGFDRWMTDWCKKR